MPRLRSRNASYGVGLHQTEQRLSLHFRWNREIHFLQQRRRYVDQLNAILDLLSGSGCMGKLDQQRHVDGLIVEKNAVGIFAVLAERLAVVGHYGYDCTVVQAAQFQLPDQLSDRCILVGDSPVVEGRRIPGLVGFRWIVGIMRVVEMNPNEKWAFRMLGQPGQRMPHNFCPATLCSAVTVFAGTFAVKPGIVSIKAPVKTRSVGGMRFEDNCAYKRRRLISVRTKNFRSVRQVLCRSEERRVGKERRSRWSPS